MYSIEFLVLDDLSDEASELFDKTNLHDPLLDKWWNVWASEMADCCEVAKELIDAINKDYIDNVNCYYRIKEYDVE